VESYGSLWKMQEQSIGILSKQGKGGPESSMKEEGKGLGKKEGSL